MSKIEDQFRDLLEHGARAAGLPDGTYAAGQYLNPYSINQRGMYGTSAALLVLARSTASADRIKLIEGIIRYVNGRSDIERSLTGSDTESSALAARLAVEWDTAFKCADLLYALSAAPTVVPGGEGLINKFRPRSQGGRRGSGGWPAALAPRGNGDPPPPASIVRALHAA